MVLAKPAPKPQINCAQPEKQVSSMPCAITVGGNAARSRFDASRATDPTKTKGTQHMTKPHINRRAAMALLPAGFLGLLGCGSGGASHSYKLPSDQPFQDMVLRAMPGYRLTSAITGRPVVRSPGFALLAVDIRDSEQVVISKFMSHLEDTGLPAVDLYYDQFGGHDGARRVRFPGCEAGSCVATAQNLPIERISEDEFHKYDPGDTPLGYVRHKIASATIAGVAYQAEVIVGYDYKGRVIRYVVNTSRVAINDIEREWAVRDARSGRSHPIDVFKYSHNLALGVSASFDNGPVMGVDSWKGL